MSLPRVGQVTHTRLSSSRPTALTTSTSSSSKPSNTAGTPVASSEAVQWELFSAECALSLQSEPEKKEVHEEKYLKLIQKYPSILKPNFKEVNPKLGIKHVIDTGEEPPCKAKTRPLLPGSEKEVKGKKAWDELVELGIVEKVPPNTPVPWSSALHLQPKPSGGLRPCGVFRDLNAKTVLDSFPLPNLRHFTHKLKGSTPSVRSIW